MRLLVLVYENRQPVATEEFDGPIEIGRQRDRDEVMYSRKPEGKRTRWVVAERTETMVGREQLHIEPVTETRVRVHNGSDKQPIRFLDGSDLAAKATVELPLPVLIILSQNKTLRVQSVGGGGGPSEHSLVDVTMPPASSRAAARLPSLMSPSGQVSTQNMLNWLTRAIDVLQAAAVSTNFYDRAAQAVIDTVMLDAARVLVHRDGAWTVATVQVAPGHDESTLPRPSQSVLTRMWTERKTCWEVLPPSQQHPESLHGIETVVASPILDKEGKIIGALYGERRQRLRAGSTNTFSLLEGQLVELLARTVAAGLSRMEEERNAATARVRMEQFLQPALAQRLLANPGLLEGRDQIVTVLFCDIRGFSQISYNLGASKTIAWCRDVLDAVTASVEKEQGVVVDYIGDGMMAMWGAPDETQTDHAARACRSALDMIDRMADINQKWTSVIGVPTQLGIGINTGEAQVGNVGSAFKFKYGALGNTVNMASRVQGATKAFKTKVLLTEHTYAAVKDQFPMRMLGKVKVIGISKEVELYELFSRDFPNGAEACVEYKKAWDLFVEARFTEAARTLGNWRAKSPEDDPVLMLLYRSVEALVKGKPVNHPVLELTEK